MRAFIEPIHLSFATGSQSGMAMTAAELHHS